MEICNDAMSISIHKLNSNKNQVSTSFVCLMAALPIGVETWEGCESTQCVEGRGLRAFIYVSVTAINYVSAWKCLGSLSNVSSLILISYVCVNILFPIL